MKYEDCPMCLGRGKLTDVSTNDKGFAEVTCPDCGGFGKKLVREKEPEVLAPDDPRATKDDEYEAERLGTVIFLIAAFVIGLNIGVSVFRLAPAMGELPIWYYIAIVAVPGFMAYFFRSIVTTLTWLAVFGALLFYGGRFLLTIL